MKVGFSLYYLPDLRQCAFSRSSHDNRCKLGRYLILSHAFSYNTPDIFSSLSSLHAFPFNPPDHIKRSTKFRIITERARSALNLRFESQLQPKEGSKIGAPFEDRSRSRGQPCYLE